MKVVKIIVKKCFQPAEHDTRDDGTKSFSFSYIDDANNPQTLFDANTILATSKATFDNGKKSKVDEIQQQPVDDANQVKNVVIDNEEKPQGKENQPCKFVCLTMIKF